MVAIVLVEPRGPPPRRRVRSPPASSLQRFHRLSSLAVLVAAYRGMRAGEIVNIRRRDIDDGGRLLRIPDAKTENDRRTLEVANALRPLLMTRT